MPKQLTTQNATITTATIEVKALTIGARQVTLAVFRQLRSEQLIAEDGTLLGTPWGTVNYHPDKCADEKEHVHVVWQKGTELRRANVQAPADAFHAHPAAGWYAHARVLDGLRAEDRDRAVRVFPRRQSMESARAWVRVEGIRFHSEVTNECAAAFELGREGDRNLLAMHRQLAAAFPDGGVSTSGLATELLAVATAYGESWAALRALPQLFIAV